MKNRKEFIAITEETIGGLEATIEELRNEITLDEGMSSLDACLDVVKTQLDATVKLCNDEDVKPQPRSFMGCDMNYYHPEDEGALDPDNVIHKHVTDPDTRDWGYDELYSDLLDCVVSGFDRFANNPLWSDGIDGFETFDQLAEETPHPLTGTTQAIYDADKVRKGFETIKEGIAQMLEGFDTEGL